MSIDDTVPGRLREALTAAMKRRDAVAVTALRSTLAAIANAEAITVVEPSMPATDGPIAGAVAGLGSTEAVRRQLTDDDVLDVVRAQITEREDAAREYDGIGQVDRARELHEEAAVLRDHLGT